MQKTKKLTLALFIQAALISTAYASEQSEAKGFVEDASGSVLFRTGFYTVTKKMVLMTQVRQHKQQLLN